MLKASTYIDLTLLYWRFIQVFNYLPRPAKKLMRRKLNPIVTSQALYILQNQDQVKRRIVVNRTKTKLREELVNCQEQFP